MEPLTIAVVEDDPEYRDAILLPLLKHSGFTPVGFGSALALYRTLLSERFDLVLLDVGLPDGSGVEIARHLRDTLPGVGIVILSGRVSPADRMRGLEAGVDAYLGKPVELQELVATLRNVAQRTRPRGPGRDVPAARGLMADGAGAVAEDENENEDGWRLGAQGWNIVAPCGSAVVLNLAERQVVSLLVASQGVPVRRETLIGGLVEDVHQFDPHRLEMLVHRLRQKCLQETGTRLPLKTVRGVGYMLAW
ncbi:MULTISPECIES: response regulator transcription factor [unclassified Luteimonas]